MSPDYSNVMADPGPEPITEATFFTATKQLEKIHAWARARYAAPWAVFGAVLLRVAATTEPTVQLPGLIGGRASLNLLCAFTSPSGGGKGISDNVAKLAWPAPIPVLPIGSGEGIAEAFRPPAKPDEDNEPLTRAIFNAPEVDTIAGLASRQGNILLATLKSVAMGEQIGQTNASKVTSRRVDAHTYRACLSVGAQPGHCGVIFADSTGGTPQRFLWFPTTDPDMPDDPSSDPAQLVTTAPTWVRTITGDGMYVVEIVYGIPAIRETVISAHLGRQRGEGDALDGHALLTRCKVAALLAIMHQRQTVTATDWELSGVVMTVSDRTRQWVLDHARQADRAKIRDRAKARAIGEDFYDNSRLETVRNSILRMLMNGGEQAGNVLRSRLGRKEKRELFDQAIALLQDQGLAEEVPGRDKGVRYRLSGQGDQGGQGISTQVKHPDHFGQGEHQKNVPQPEKPSSHDSDALKPTCQRWFDGYIADLRSAGIQYTDSFAAYEAGRAAGYGTTSIANASATHPDVRIASKNGRAVRWCIDPDEDVTYVPVAEFVSKYLADLPPGAVEVNQADFFRRAADAGYDRSTARKILVRDSGRIDSVPARGNSKVDRRWLIRTTEEVPA